MKLHSLSLKGITCYRDVVSVDFRTLPSGLVAIVGPNGGGKSSLIESAYAALYRELPTRNHKNLYAFCHGKDAFVDLTFEMGGHIYRSRVLINAQSEDQKAFLECDGLPLEECKQGRLAPFTKAVERIVGSSKLLLSSVFAVQTRRGSFADLSIAERKILFVELLGLDQFPEYEQRAKAEGATVASELERQRAVRELKAQERDRALILQEEIRQATADHDALEAQLRTQMSHVEILTAQEQQAATQLAGLEATLNAQREQWTTSQNTLRLQLSEIRGKIDTRQRELQRLVAEHRRQQQQWQVRQRDIEKAIGEKETLVQRADAIRQAVAQHQQYKKDLLHLDVEWSQAAEAENVRAREQGQLQKLEAVHHAVSEKLDSYRAGIDEVQQVPCHGEGIYATCVKLTNVQQYRKELPALYKQLEDSQLTMAWIRGRLAQDGHRPPKTIKAQRDQVQAHLAGLEKDVQAASTLDTAEERLQELRNMLAEVQQQLMQIGPEMDATADPLMTELELQQQAVTAEQARLQLEIEHSDHVQKLNEVRGLRNHRAEARRVAESLVQASQVRIRDADRRLATLTGEAERLQDAARVCAEAESQIAKLETEATDWALLARACGSNGVPALEIDAAGPAISALVNDLLAACFSTRFSVQVQTQKQAADGKRLLEDFSLRVIDTERGRDGTLDDLSGGERIIVAEALAMGIAIYNKGQHHLSTLFRDETTGQLDVATAPKYVQMLRRAMALGQFHRVLFITHSPDCAALADAVIRCNNGTIAVEI